MPRVEMKPQPVTTVRNREKPLATVHHRFDPQSGVGVALAYVRAGQEQDVREAVFVLAVARSVETVKSQRGNGARSSVARDGVARNSPVQPVGSVASVMDCIKSVESGNYSESSHPGSGSGAYQYVPQTWRTWSARAGYPGYAYAYQAPPAVQDAVTAFVLNNGGAHNWDPMYGNDSCTVRLP